MYKKRDIIKRAFLFICFILLLIPFSQLSLAYRTPLGDVYPHVDMENNRFAVYWVNTVTQKTFRAEYNSVLGKFDQSQEMNDIEPSKVWDYRINGIDYLMPFFDTSCMSTFNRVGDHTIVGGIGKNTLYELRLIEFNSKDKMISRKMIGYVGRIWDKPVASNIEVDQNNAYIAWVSINNGEHSNLVLTRWNMQTSEINHQLVQEGSGCSIPSIAIHNGQIGLAFYKLLPNQPHFRIVFKRFKKDSLEEISSTIINYTND